MTTAPAQLVTTVYDDTRNDSDIDHIWCDCTIDIALCGADITGLPVIDAPVNACVVCSDLDDTGARCPTCTGAPATG